MALVMTLPNQREIKLLEVAEAEAPGGVEAIGGSAPATRPVWLLSLSVFLLHSVMTLLFVALPPMLVDGFGFLLTEHWKIYVPAMVGSVILMLPILRHVGKNMSEARMLPWAFFILALAVGILPVSANLGALGAILAVYFLGFNLLEASMPSLISRITGSRGRGRRLGLYSTFQFLGAFVGGVAGGWLLGRFGSQAALIAASVVTLAWGIVLKLSSASVFPTGEPR